MLMLSNMRRCLPNGLVAQGIEILGNTTVMHASGAGAANTCPGWGRHLADGPACQARVVGIDGRAWRRGQGCGTLIGDLERRRVIGLLPDREPATVEAWLWHHPQIEVVARNRNGGHGGAVSRALPGAIQVADRWHLLENASTAFLSAVQRAMPEIRKVPGSTRLDPVLLTAAERLQYDGFQRRRQTSKMVRQMAQDGVPIQARVRVTGLSRKLVRQIVRGEREDVFRVRESRLTRWLPDLEPEWAAGCRNGAELWRRRRATGFRGSLRVVGEWATRQRRAETAMPIGMGRSPPARKIARLMTTERDHLCKADAGIVARIEAELPAVTTARALTDCFTDMVRNGREPTLSDWLNAAESSATASFAHGLRSDQDAVAAARREPWSNGPTKGQINRLKALKRQMYGRAGIDLPKPRPVAIA